MLANLSEGDLRLLRVFAKVVEAGGFSAAQIELNVSQSTISTHMTALEQRLRVRLCERGPNVPPDTLDQPQLRKDLIHDPRGQ